MLKTAITLSISLQLLVGTVPHVAAQAYPIDCAILLCLSGGWPESAPCSAARAEFIRRITPWPIEPPLQIWRCPMGATQRFGQDRANKNPVWVHAVNQRPLTDEHELLVGPTSVMESSSGATPDLSPDGLLLRLIQDRADIDISSPEFDFVRSIRVFDVRYARQRRSESDGNCYRHSIIYLGTYGDQGDFSWKRTSPSALPAAHTGLEQWGQNCPNFFNRSVFVEWRDYMGHYGYEQIDY